MRWIWTFELELELRRRGLNADSLAGLTVARRYVGPAVGDLSPAALDALAAFIL
jgi:hypothetical protein